MSGKGGGTRTIKTSVGNQDVQDIFAAMLGHGSADPNITWPKYKKVRRHVCRAVQTLSWLVDRPWLQKAFPVEHQNIKKYVATLTREYADHFATIPDLDKYIDPLLAQALGGDVESELDLAPNFETSVPPAEVEAFTSKYKGSVESDLVNTLVTACRNLSDVKASIEDRENLDKRFLLGAGLTFAPIPELPAANFKAFFQSPALTDNEKETILVFLHKLYTVSHDVYVAASLPDVNVDEFVSVIMTAMDDLKKHIPRCDEAFSKITDSVELLRGNFATYNRDMKQSGNPGIIMENFVLDVSATSGKHTSAKVKMQFKKIISHYRKMAQSRPLDHKAKALFGEIDRNFAAMEAADDAGDAGGEPSPPDCALPVSTLPGSTLPGSTLPVSTLSVSTLPGNTLPGDRPLFPEEAGDAPAQVVDKVEAERRRKSRAQARRAAAKSLDAQMNKPMPVAGNESELYRELCGAPAKE